MAYRPKRNSNYFNCVCMIVLACSIPLFIASTSSAQEEQQRQGARGKVSELPAAQELAWPLPTAVDKSYDSMNASKLKNYVEQQAAISDKYRDLDPSNLWWGRISGMPSGAAEQAWVEQKFKDIGLPFESHVIDMGAQDWPKTWSITVTANGKSVKLESANPIIDFTSYMASPQGDEDLDAVWVGLGQPSDFIGKDVRGKAVFIYSIAKSQLAGPIRAVDGLRGTGAEGRREGGHRRSRDSRKLALRQPHERHFEGLQSIRLHDR